MTRPTLTLALILSVLLGSACLSGSGVKPQWVEAPIQAPTEQVLWDAALLALQKQGYPLGAVVDRSGGQLVSGWKTSLAAFRSKGWRSKAWIEFHRNEAGLYAVKVRVQKEINQDIVRPLDASYARWEESADDEGAARILLQTVRSYLSPELPIEDERKARAAPERTRSGG